jgi:DNA polymerase I
MGVPPNRVRDLKALTGDSSDGVSGVTGIGQKTAVKLLDQFGSINAIYEALDNGEDLEGFPAHISKKLRTGDDDALIAYMLVGMVENLPLDFDTLRTPTSLTDAAYGEQLETLGLKDIRSVLA